MEEASSEVLSGRTKAVMQDAYETPSEPPEILEIIEFSIVFTSQTIVFEAFRGRKRLQKW